MIDEPQTNLTMGEQLAAVLREALFEANRDEHEGTEMTGERLARTGVVQHYIAQELRTYGIDQLSVRARASEWDCAP